MASDGYYALYDYPKEMTTDTAGTFKMSKIDMTTNDVTYSFKYDFICDGVTTSKTVAMISPPFSFIMAYQQE